jgi:hypothetical protein
MAKKIIRLKRWKVEVLNEEVITNYIVIAVNELDARIIAFCLDGGFPYSMTKMKRGHVELVQMHTKILEVSRFI